MSARKAAVITGDVIASSGLSTAQRKKLQSKLQQFFTQTARQFPDFKADQYRGDSLQMQLTRSRASALQVALQLQTFLRMHGFSIRLGIGVGDIQYTARQVSISDGTAFRLSGPLADELKKQGGIIAITGNNAAFSSEWQVHSIALNYLLAKTSQPQAEALYLQLQGLTQEQIAKKLGISQPSVHQRLQASGWSVLQAMLQRFAATVPSV